MQTVGMFAGRGDVVLAMVVSLALGSILGWYVRGAAEWVLKKYYGR